MIQEDRIAARIIDRGRGPELEGTRITVYCVMDYVHAGDSPARIAQELDLSEQQVQEAIEYINAHRDEVETAYGAILKRVNQPNPDWVEARLREDLGRAPASDRGTNHRSPGAYSSWPITTSGAPSYGQ